MWGRVSANAIVAANNHDDLFKTMNNIQTDSYTGGCQADFRALLGVSGAALGSQIANQVLHQCQVGTVPLIPAFLRNGNQLRVCQGFEVK